MIESEDTVRKRYSGWVTDNRDRRRRVAGDDKEIEEIKVDKLEPGQGQLRRG